MTCKDCLHYEACKEWYTEEAMNAYVADFGCSTFTDKSEWVHLPCRIGDKIFRVSPLNEIWYWEIVKIEIYKDETLFIDDGDNDFTSCDIHKSVFLTREEAKKHLKEGKKED